MIDDLLPSSKASSKGKENTLEIKTTVTFSHDSSTKKLLDDLVWLKKFVIDMKEISQGDLVREALELLAKKIDYKTLSVTYAKQLQNSKPKPGRKKRKQ